MVNTYVLNISELNYYNLYLCKETVEIININNNKQVIITTYIYQGRHKINLSINYFKYMFKNYNMDDYYIKNITSNYKTYLK
jgi:hypothetical protein